MAFLNIFFNFYNTITAYVWNNKIVEKGVYKHLLLFVAVSLSDNK